MPLCLNLEEPNLMHTDTPIDPQQSTIFISQYESDNKKRVFSYEVETIEQLSEDKSNEKNMFINNFSKQNKLVNS